MSNQTSEYQQHLELIREIKYFSAMGLEAQKVLAYLCVRESYKTDEIVFSKGDIDLTAYYVISGRLDIYLEENDQSVGHFKPGDFFGALSLLGDTPRLFTLKSSEETSCISLTKNKFSKIKQQFPDISDKFTVVAIEALSNWEKRFLKNVKPSCAGCLSTLGLTLI